MKIGPPDILVTGGTGYVGSRLLTALESKGRAVRCLARNPESLQWRAGPAMQVIAGDCLRVETLAGAFQGIRTAYYLVHSMGATADFAALDREAARNFAVAAAAAGVRRIIYLGGLGREDDDLSEHLKSRHETGDVLRLAGVPVVEFRASIVIGSGSLSFEMVRALVERLPVMICPKWVGVRAQPIAVEDLIAYLVAALDLPEGPPVIYEIGGPDEVSYRDIMMEYARQRRLRRLLIPVPILTPRLSSLWLGLVTPLYARVGRLLIESMRNPTVVRSPRSHEDFGIRPRGMKEAIARALSLEDAGYAATRWSDPMSSAAMLGAPRPDESTSGGARLGSRIVDHRVRVVAAPASRTFAVIQRIGGGRGWYAFDSLWRLRGFLDLLAGGIGMRRGRRDPETLRCGDALDFWRVEAFEPDRLLRLWAEMKLPGRAWLQFEVKPLSPERSEIHQTALFDPAGVSGLLYWYVLYPLHALIFRRMLSRIREIATTSPQGA